MTSWIQFSRLQTADELSVKRCWQQMTENVRLVSDLECKDITRCCDPSVCPSHTPRVKTVRFRHMLTIGLEYQYETPCWKLNSVEL